MRLCVMLIAAALLPWTASARTTDADCANARDPGRCEARQAALRACSEKRGMERRACLDASMPPVDCSKSREPAKCEAAQKAKDLCKGKTGKQLKQCLREEQPRKKMPRKPRPAT